MPKLTCPCGFVHDLSPIPDEGWLAIRDRDYEELMQAESARLTTDNREIADEAEKKWSDFVGTFYECPKCGRLMWARAGERIYRVYSPDVTKSA